LRAQPDQLERKLDALLAEREKLAAKLAEAIKGGAAAKGEQLEAGAVTLFVTPSLIEERTELGALADAFRRDHRAAMLVLVNPAIPTALTVAVTDDLVAAGKDANAFVKLVTAQFGGRGGGRPTFASGSLAVPSVERVAIEQFPAIIRTWTAG
jgi:alanyl-tRNA synthetase